MFKPQTILWDQLTGPIPFEERQFILYMCEKGIASCQRCLDERNGEHQQSKGGIQAFEAIMDIEFYDDLKQNWDHIGDIILKKLARKDMDAFWLFRGRQLQIEFVLERITAMRHLLHQTTGEYVISARAGIYAGEYLQGLNNV